MKTDAKTADTTVGPRKEPRLPPGQVRTEKWPVLHYGSVPAIKIENWDFRVFGLVKLPRVTLRSDIHCVTRWSRFDNTWEGVSIREVLGLAGVKPDAAFAIAHAEQGFTTNLPLEELNQDDVLLADRHDGVELTPEHGWPLRLVVPRHYFWKSAKWIRAIEITAADRPGFWEQNGYHNAADPWKEERFSDW